MSKFWGGEVRRLQMKPADLGIFGLVLKKSADLCPKFLGG